MVPARGMRDILPADKAKRDRVLDVIRGVYRKNGFSEIETPAVESLARLLSNQGGENEKMIFEILKRGLPNDVPVLPKEAVDLGLRYDLTVPLTRFYATHVNELPRVFRALQVGPVWRAERPQKGRYRQFLQCDIDIIGDDSTVAEIDLLTTTLTAFKALGMAPDIALLVNDRRILVDLLTACNIDPANHGEALIILDKIDKIGPQKVLNELVGKGVATAEDASKLLEASAYLRDNSQQIIERGSAQLPGGIDVDLRELPDIVAAVKELVPWATIRFDATLVRGMGYYTGPIFEVKHTRFDFSVAGGGRYDKVVGKWLGRDVPACGFSIGFERIIDLVSLPEDQTSRVALLYKPGCDPKSLFALRAQLLDAGNQVGLVVPPRRLNAAFFDALVEDGYTAWVDGRNSDGATEPKALHVG